MPRSRCSVTVAARYGTRNVVAAGMALVAAGLTGLSFATASTPYLPYAVALVAIAAGMGLSVPSLSTGIMASLPPARAGMGSGLNSAAREIGAALGIAVVGSVLASQFTRDLPKELQGGADSTSQALREAQRLGNAVAADAVDAFTHAMAAGYRVIAVVVLVAAGLVFRGLTANARASSSPAESEQVAA